MLVPLLILSPLFFFFSKKRKILFPFWSLVFVSIFRYYRFNENTRSVDSDYPKPINTWSGVPDDIKGAIINEDRGTWVYMFTCVCVEEAKGDEGGRVEESRCHLRCNQLCCVKFIRRIWLGYKFWFSNVVPSLCTLYTMSTGNNFLSLCLRDVH